MATDRLTQADYEQLAAFRHLLRRFASFSANAARQAGLTTNQHQALLAIKAHPGAMSVGLLAGRLIIAPHTAAELVGRLEGADLVDKIEDANDRRRVRVQLTRRAEEVLLDLTLTHPTSACTKRRGGGGTADRRAYRAGDRRRRERHGD